MVAGVDLEGVHAGGVDALALGDAVEGELVDPAGAGDDDRPEVAELVEDAGHHRPELRVADAKRLAAHPGGVGQRTDHVEDGPDAELPPGRGGVAHRRVVGGGEHEADPRLLDAAAHPRRGQGDGHPERLEDVGASAAAGGGAVAVLGHRHPSTGHHQGGGGGDVEGTAAVATGAAGVDGVDPQVNVDSVFAHRHDHAGELVDGLPAGPQRDQDAADLGRGGDALHDPIHHRARGGGVEVVAAEQGFQRVPEDRIRIGHRPGTVPGSRLRGDRRRRRRIG